MNRSYGFTLIELMVVVALVAILATVAIPGFREMIANNRQVSRLNEIVASLHLARSEAVKSGASVSVCASAGPNYDACSGVNAWEDGWIVFVENAPANGDFDAGETLLQVFQDFDVPDLTLRAKNGAADVTSLTFNARGASNTPATFTLCDDRGAAKGRQVELSLTGRPSIRASGTAIASCT
ncbi:MAG TPA: GspH/FimT family pseudopilin [Gammaproteobacteria bacterium]|nr:GspH/FimT family pseudopilin [Gammaproteobacteria bacterium]